MTVYRRILVGYDGSNAGRKAFDAALGLAAENEAELFILAVARPPDIGDDVETEAVIENSRRYHHRLLEELKAGITTKDVKLHYEVAIGHPAEQIIYSADKHGVDLIVVGDRGHSTFVRLLLGSVSRHVVEHAGRPVMVVR